MRHENFMLSEISWTQKDSDSTYCEISRVGRFTENRLEITRDWGNGELVTAKGVQSLMTKSGNIQGCWLYNITTVPNASALYA